MKQLFNSANNTFRIQVIGLILAISVFASCTKPAASAKEDFHVTCSVDGIPVSFNTSTFAHVETQAGLKAITINGATNSSLTAGSVGFVITNTPSGDAIAAGTYKDTDTKYELLASYAPNISVTAYDAGTTLYSEAKSLGVTITNHFTVTITSMTTETVKGTFSGDFYYDLNPLGAKKTITNGDFFVKFQ
jgi:hypothetical protein